MKMQVVIPMGGVGQRFLNAGYIEPKPLLDIAGEPLIKRLVLNFPPDWRFVFACNKEHLQKWPMEELLRRLIPHAVIVPIEGHKWGPVHSVLEAAKEVDDKLPTIVNYCDFSFEWDPEKFSSFLNQTNCDGAVFCYRGFHPHYLGNMLYAYCREENGRIAEIREKAHFTPDRTREFASSGTYYFSSGQLMKEAFLKAKKENLSTNGEFYVSLAYNPLIRDKRDIRVYEIPTMLQWGTPEDVEDYVYWHRTFMHFSPSDQNNHSENPRLLMPMAGFGSRFKESENPKPLIPVLNNPMFLTARSHLPCSTKKSVFVIRKELEPAFEGWQSAGQYIVLPSPTRGQAESVLKGLDAFEKSEPVLISACDHGFLWDQLKWENLLNSTADAIVVGQRGYPGARRTPRSYAYIDANASGQIRRVSVKEPMSSSPQKDLLLVGTFYFRCAGQLKNLIETFLEKGQPVGGEYYLDSVVNLAVEHGLDVRVFESDAYLNWGSPDALSEFSYWQKYFQRGSR